MSKTKSNGKAGTIDDVPIGSCTTITPLSPSPCSALQSCANRIAGHIRNPMDIHAIIADIESNEYNAELVLQHLLLWAAKTESASQKNLAMRSAARNELSVALG